MFLIQNTIYRILLDVVLKFISNALSTFNAVCGELSPYVDCLAKGAEENVLLYVNRV
jgi:hypothetical protein